MKIASINVSRLAGLGLAALALGLTGCHTAGRTVGQTFNDRMTAHDVKAALSDSPVYKFEAVKPVVFEGKVQLTGFVQTQRQREQAANIASGVKGVREVVNDLMIMPTPTGRAHIQNGYSGTGGRTVEGNNAPANAAAQPNANYQNNNNNNTEPNTPANNNAH